MRLILHMNTFFYLYINFGQFCPDLYLYTQQHYRKYIMRTWVQWNPSCEASPFASEKWPFKRGGLSSGWPLKRGSTVYTYMVTCIHKCKIQKKLKHTRER